MQTIAITSAITTLTEAQQRFNLDRTEDETFFTTSRVFTPFISNQELYNVLQVLKSIKSQ